MENDQQTHDKEAENLNIFSNSVEHFVIILGYIIFWKPNNKIN